MKILVTGGHLTPAYAFCEYAADFGDSLFYVGSQDNNSLEAKEIQHLPVTYIHLPCVKLNRYDIMMSIVRLPLFIISLFRAIGLLVKLRPDCVVSFGSFNALPIGLASWLLRIPLAIHEQTRAVGLANMILWPLAGLRAAAFTETFDNRADDKHIVTGNLLRSDLLKESNTFSHKLPTSKPIMFITGGNQGARAINEAVALLIPDLIRRYQVVWQTGLWSVPPGLKDEKEIIFAPWFNAADMSWLLHHARIVISRAGANTIAEIAAARIPSIVIPLPKASGDEQLKNAQMLADAKVSILIHQKTLDEGNLAAAIESIESNYDSFVRNANDLTLMSSKKGVQAYYEAIKAMI